MRLQLLLGAFLSLAIVPARASWNDVTDSIQGSHVSVGAEGKQKKFLELIPGKPVQIELKKKTSTRWKIESNGKGNLTLAMNGAPVQSKVIAKGENDFKIFLEPGKYKLTTTIGARAKCFFWRKRKLTSLVPDGGGYATYMETGDQKFAYYRATPDTVPVLGLRGPTHAFIFFRADIPKGAHKVTVDLTVKSEDSTVSHKIMELAPSEKSGVFEDSARSISEAMVVKIEVPDGLRKYSIHLNKCTGFVKFYKSEKKKKKLSPTDQNESLNTDKPEEDPTESDLAEAEDSTEATEAMAERDKTFRFGIRMGAYRDNNVYRYSSGYRDTFDLGLKAYRYPGVKSISDFTFPMETHISADIGDYTAGAGIAYDAYAGNTNLNKLGFHLSLAWSGPLKLKAVYRLTPRDPIRPTFYVTRPYEMMSYSENRGTLSAQWSRWDIKPSLDFSYGYYDYNATFDAYDAPFFEGGIALSRPKRLGFRIDLEAGSIMAKHHTGEDWSNIYGSAGADAHVPWRAWTAGLKGSFTTRSYGSGDTTDTHNRRKDFSGDGSGYIKYRWTGIGISAKTGWLWRTTTSPFRVIDQEKDYLVFVSGLEVSWELSV